MTDDQKSFFKVIVRRLPPKLTKAQFELEFSPLPPYKNYVFCAPLPRFKGSPYPRVYIEFLKSNDVYVFKEKFDGYIFKVDRGVQFPAIIEFAPNQGSLDKAPKADPKQNTYETDSDYILFVESLEANFHSDVVTPMNTNMKIDEECCTTPLLEYLRARREEKNYARERKRKDEEEKRRKRLSEDKFKRKEAQEALYNKKVEKSKDIMYFSPSYKKKTCRSKDINNTTPLEKSMESDRLRAEVSTSEITNTLKELLKIPNKTSYESSQTLRLKNKNRPALQIYNPAAKHKIRESESKPM